MAREPFANWAERTRYVPWLAGFGPLAYYVAGASAHGGFFEEGSFVAAARNLGVAHAPGGPIEALLAATFAQLPVGPLSYRVALVSAVCAALTLALFSRALLLTLAHVGLAEPETAGPLALSGALWLGQTPLFFAEAVRPHLFSAQFALSMLIIYTLLRFEAEEPHGARRVLYFGAFVQGLCFANHHVYGLLMLPLAAPTLGRVFARRGFIGLMGYLTAPVVGFSVYLYVPLRLAHDPHSPLADESGVKRLLTVLAGEPYAGPAYLSPVPVFEALRSGLGLSSDALLVALLSLMLLGAFITLRSSYRRRFGTLWFLALAVPLISALLSLQPRIEEDAWGVLLPCAAGVVAMACAGTARLFGTFAPIAPRLTRAAALGLCAASALGFALKDGGAGAARVALGDRMDELSRRELSADATLLLEEAGSVFRYQGREAEEALRPDVAMVPLALSGVPHAVDRWVERQPELRGCLGSWVLRGELDTASLQSLANQRAVYLEPSVPKSADLYASTLDEGLLLRVFSDAPTATDLRSERGAQAARLGRLYPLPRATLDRELRLSLGRVHLFQAFTRAALSDREGARDYLALSARDGFEDPRAALLSSALTRPEKVSLQRLLQTERAP